MKKIFLLALLTMIFGAQMAQAQDKQTEEYAIIELREYPLSIHPVLFIFVGEEQPVTIHLKDEEKPRQNEMTVLLREMSKLNKKGFRAINMNTTYYSRKELSDYVDHPRISVLMVRQLE